MSEEKRNEIQEEYNALDFAPGTSVIQTLTTLAEKHGLTYSEVLKVIEL